MTPPIPESLDFSKLPRNRATFLHAYAHYLRTTISDLDEGAVQFAVSLLQDALERHDGGNPFAQNYWNEQQAPSAVAKLFGVPGDDPPRRWSVRYIARMFP